MFERRQLLKVGWVARELKQDDFYRSSVLLCARYSRISGNAAVLDIGRMIEGRVLQTRASCGLMHRSNQYYVSTFTKSERWSR